MFTVPALSAATRNKANPDDYPYGHGPQGDVVRINNYVRMVRDMESSSLKSVNQ